MANATELRKRFREVLHEHHYDEAEGLHRTFDVNAVEDWIVSEIEQAEKAKVEEVIDILKRIACFEIPVTNERDQGFVDALDSAISQIENKFLTKPNDE